MEDLLNRCWAVISVDHLEWNIKQIRHRLHAGCHLMAVVKANAYGHGDAALIPYLERFGIDWLAVSNLDEAISLRKNGAELPIFILGDTPVRFAHLLHRYHITQSVYSAAYAKALEAEAEKSGVTVDVHVKIDTGMTRIGFSPDSPDEIEKVYQSERLRCTGIFTHFACSDELGEEAHSYTHRQYERFCNLCGELVKRGIEVGMRHCGNSGAVEQYPKMQLDMVRPGIILYGLAPSAELRGRMELRPVMTLFSRISMIKTVPAGTPVSYGRTFVTSRETQIATVTCGYADGYPRALSGKACILVAGKPAPVIGRVCMDQLLLDITGISPVHEGDEVIVAGFSEENGVSFETLADMAGTIPYELTCNINRRVPRVYRYQHQVVKVVDYLE